MCKATLVYEGVDPGSQASAISNSLPLMGSTSVTRLRCDCDRCATFMRRIAVAQ